MKNRENNGFTYVDKIKSKGSGKTVIEYYLENYPHTTEKQWDERFLSERIYLNGVITDKDVVLNKEDKVEYKRRPWVEPEVRNDFTVVYEDEDILVINKPSGLPVLPASLYLENTLLCFGKNIFGEKFTPMHRIDKGTTGCVLCAKTVKGRKFLGKQFQRKKIEKYYKTVVQGEILRERFTINASIGFENYPMLGKVSCISKKGKDALTEIIKVKTGFEKKISLVKIRLHTGRTHQIRIHFAYAGFPLIGEIFYGKGGVPIVKGEKCNLLNDVLPGDTGFLLHSSKLEFLDLQGKSISAEAELPLEFNKYLKER